MCTSLSNPKIFLNVDVQKKDCQIVHIHNGPIAKLVLLAEFIMFDNNKNRLKKITYRLISQQQGLSLSLKELTYNRKKTRFKVVLEPFKKRRKIVKELEYIPEFKLLMKPNSEFTNQVRFFLNNKERDLLSGDTNVGDQACNFKVSKPS